MVDLTLIQKNLSCLPGVPTTYLALAKSHSVDRAEKSVVVLDVMVVKGIKRSFRMLGVKYFLNQVPDLVIAVPDLVIAEQ